MDTLPPFPVNQDLHPELRQFLDETKADIGELKTALIGNKLGQKGVIPRLDDVEKTQAEQGKSITKAYILLSGAGVTLLFFKEYIADFFRRS